MNTSIADSFRVREVVEKWSLYRDAGEFDRLLELFHDEGRIYTLWFQGTKRQFVERARSIFGGGMASVHYLCGTQVDIVSDRAVARSNLKTYGRGVIDAQEYDAEATGQFCDLLEKRDGRWAICERWVAHIKDRLDATQSDRPLRLDQDLLQSLPQHYQHLAYLHAKAGREIKRNMPGLEGESAALLKARAALWLGAKALPAAF